MAPRSPAPHDGALLVRRGILIATAVLAVLLLLLLWPVAAALRDAVAAAIQARADLIATVLLVIALLLAIGLVRIVFAVGRKLDAQADQAAIVRLENQHPVHLADVRQGRVQLIERSLEWQYQTEQVGAECSQFPNLSSVHQAIRMEGGATLPPVLTPPRSLPHSQSIPIIHCWRSSASGGTTRVGSPCTSNWPCAALLESLASHVSARPCS
jgi:hypothetical protein